MECRTAAQTTQEWITTAHTKAQKTAGRTFVSSMFAGAIIAFGSIAAATASFTIGGPSASKLVAGLLFPFGLAIIILLGADLFTGNILLAIPVLGKSMPATRMLRNLLWVYAGNFTGGFLLASAYVYSGQLKLGGDMLGVYTIQVAAAKCSLPFGQAFVLGILCNLLVCAGVLLAQTATGTTGKILGCYLPVSFFVIGGFEHCVANMYYIPAGLFALENPAYASLAAAAGINISQLTWGHFFAANLLPVTLGNLAGGLLIALYMWYCHGYTKKQTMGGPA